MNREKFESPGYDWDWNSQKTILTRADARFMILWDNFDFSYYRCCWPTLEQAIEAALKRPQYQPAYIIDRVHDNEKVHQF